MAKRKSKKKQTNNSIIVTIFLTVLVVGVIAYLALTQGNIMSNDAHVAAYVNGIPIKESALDAEYQKIPSEYEGLISKEEILDQMINKELLLQEAEKQGIEVTEEEVESQLLELQSQLPEELFTSILTQQNLTIEELRSEIQEQILLSKLLNNSVFQSIEVTDEEIKDYYQQNKDLFKTAQGQIRIEFVVATDEDQINKVIEYLKKEVPISALTVVDSSLKIQTGSGFLTKGVEPEDLEDAAFALRVGEISSPIQTAEGYYVIKRLPDTITIIEAKDTIKEQILSDSQNDATQKYIKTLISRATIIKKNITTVTAKTVIPTNNFTEVGKGLCTGDTLPTIRAYFAEDCLACENMVPVLKESAAQRDFELKIIYLDKAISKGLDTQELAILKEYNKGGAVPSYLISCRYFRIGNAATQFDADVEKSEIEKILARV